MSAPALGLALPRCCCCQSLHCRCCLRRHRRGPGLASMKQGPVDTVWDSKHDRDKGSACMRLHKSTTQVHTLIAAEGSTNLPAYPLFNTFLLFPLRHPQHLSFPFLLISPPHAHHPPDAARASAMNAQRRRPGR